MDIVDSDAFLDMPSSTQNLYFHLGMRADDDGFISNPKKVMRMVSAQEDDYNLLVAKRFLIKFEGGLCVIKHWRMNNRIRADRYVETVYLGKKECLQIKPNGAYTERGIPSGIPDDNHMTPQYRIEENRIEENRIHMSAIADDSFDTFWSSYPKKELKKKSKEIWKSKKLHTHLQEILDFIVKAKQTERWNKGFIKQPPTFLRNECWLDDITSYGGSREHAVYKNKTDNKVIDKLKNKQMQS